MHAKLFHNLRSHAVHQPTEFRFEGMEVEVHRDPETGAVLLTPLRTSARCWLAPGADAQLQQPGLLEDLTAVLTDVLDPRPPRERAWP